MKKSLKHRPRGSIALVVLMSLVGIGIITTTASADDTDISGALACGELQGYFGATGTAGSGTFSISLAEACETSALTVKSGQNVTLDLAGFTLTGTSTETLHVNSGGSLTITDNAVDGQVTNNLTSNANVIVNYGTLTVENGIVTARTSTNPALLNYGTATLRGGTFTTPIAMNSNAKLNISGGLYQSTIGPANTATGFTVSLTGGLYSIEPDSDYVASGYHVTQLETGFFTVVAGGVTIEPAVPATTEPEPTVVEPVAEPPAEESPEIPDTAGIFDLRPDEIRNTLTITVSTLMLILGTAYAIRRLTKRSKITLK